MKMTKTDKKAALKQPHNYWINRRIYLGEDGREYVKINYIYIAIDALWVQGWDVERF